MMTFAVHNIHVPAIQIDEQRTYAIAGDGPRFNVEPLATFDTFDEAEEWRGKRLAEVRGTAHG
ncbi:hypothetical protein [Sphingopyxis sp. PET50]|uniref:hypothetical protein n=1 Tax=Sphingopyxis sp. PET50 TaxID=2976533 RepID=UPI0021AFD12F|nr:hypothetical protein [Sphingopyxis sp. PET50]